MSSQDSASKHPPQLPGEQKLIYLLTVTGLSMGILVLLYLILQELANILQPLFVAIFICYLIVPAHQWLVARRIPSILSYVIIVGSFLIVLLAAGSMAYQGVKTLSSEMPSHIERIRRSVDDANERLREQFMALLPESMHDEDEDEVGEDAATTTQESEGGHEREAENNINDGQQEAIAATGETLVEDDDSDSSLVSAAAEGVYPPSMDVAEEGTAIPQVPGNAGRTQAMPRSSPSLMSSWFSTNKIVGWAQSTLDPLFGIVTGTLVVLFYLIFLLAEVAGFRRRLVGAFGAVRANRILQVVHSINSAISHYIAVKTFVSFLTGSLSTVVLLMFDVKYALIWGILTFFANFIPYVGSLVAVILPVMMNFALFGPSWELLLLLGLLVSAQSVVGNVIEPRMIGQKLGISPLIILLGLAFWGYLWGIPGMILSAPLTVAAKIVLENIDQTRPVARLISNV